VSDRDARIAAFLKSAGWGDAKRAKLAGDASFRRYERLAGGPKPAVLMDAPPPKEDVRPFLAVARRLKALGFSAPEIYAEDVAAGLLLLEDLGDDTFTRVLAAEPGRETTLYTLATDALIALHRAFKVAAGDPPRFDDARAIAEAERLLDWTWPATYGREAPAAVRADFRAAWAKVLPAWRGVPDSLILYDFHVDNLMWLKGRKGAAACGLLDFQDALVGPAGFDLMSLLQDVRRHVPDALAEAMIRRYLDALPGLDRDAFRASYAVGGAQRNIRILGTFIRLWKRDSKPGYLRWLPRTWAVVEADLAHPALAPLKAWFEEHFPAARRALDVAAAS
jgi:aminoglycoside/choline kinase family phosphotransferase